MTTILNSVPALEDRLRDPSPRAIDVLAASTGDILILGAGGKMGPTLAGMARRALDAAGQSETTVYAASRFSDPEIAPRLEEWGVKPLIGDLTDETFLKSLPDAPRVYFLAGRKFGSEGGEPLTWALNAHLPGLVCRRFAGSRIVALSTGNIYGLTPVQSCGSVESDPLNAEGEYAWSCVGRERIFQHYSQTAGLPVALIRLNYANECRYGILVDLARRVLAGESIDLTMGHVNLIWQGDANAMILAAMGETASPATVLNVAGKEVLEVEKLARSLGAALGREPVFAGKPSKDALLSCPDKASSLLGLPEVTIEEMIDQVASWVKAGGETYGKPTRFEVRNGVF